MKAILNFYAPFTSPWTSPQFQKWEGVLPVVVALVFATLSMLPLLSVGNWFTSILCVLGMTIILHTVYCWGMNRNSEQTNEGKYISPGMVPSVMVFILFTRLVITGLGLLLTLYFTGYQFK